MDLVGGICVPNDEFTVLRSGDEVSAVGGPVHGVDLCKMALEGTLGLHGQARQGLHSLFGDIADCMGMLAEAFAWMGVGGTYGLCQQAHPSSALSCP